MIQILNSEVIQLNDGNSDYSYNEAIKTLRTNIQFCGNSISVIMMTSALPDEGKSDISVSLAMALAQIGKKTLILDADIRKSVLTTRYQVVHKVNGLSQYLSGQKKLEEIIYQTSHEKLDLIFAGPYSPNPAELLEESLFGNLLEELRANYDYVIIDTPPLGNIIDAAIIAQKCDGAVLVIESGMISYRLEQKVKSQLEKSGCRILGAVLNRVDFSEDKRYGHYGMYGKYKKYYGHKK